eukprot:scaffold58932_cov22-Tisochrysis_lutea.AAC.1
MKAWLVCVHDTCGWSLNLNAATVRVYELIGMLVALITNTNVRGVHTMAGEHTKMLCDRCVVQFRREHDGQYSAIRIDVVLETRVF